MYTASQANGGVSTTHRLWRKENGATESTEVVGLDTSRTAPSPSRYRSI
ncbi:hypothetical protein [Natronococcus wangiae]|nr:hypothetical protein [Natronococcus sp. AD5]